MSRIMNVLSEKTRELLRTALHAESDRAQSPCGDAGAEAYVERSQRELVEHLAALEAEVRRLGGNPESVKAPATVAEAEAERS